MRTLPARARRGPPGPRRGTSPADELAVLERFGLVDDAGRTWRPSHGSTGLDTMRFTTEVLPLLAGARRGRASR